MITALGGAGHTSPITFLKTMTNNTVPQSILDAAETLRVELERLQVQQDAVNEAKAQLLNLMVAAGDTVPNTLKTEWGQVQRVTKVEWEYRDRGVTEQNKVVEGHKKSLTAAQKLLKGLEEAAKAAGKAKRVGETTTLRVVSGTKA
jgi:hypothetical protein